MKTRRTKHDHLIEYLFVDQNRLDSYSNQIGPPVTYDKVPVWSAEIGLTGPKAGATQERSGRKPTIHEQVTALVSHLQANDLLFEGRPPSQAYPSVRQRVFVLESCEATSLIVPPAGRRAAKSPLGLKLWLSLPPNEEKPEADPWRRPGMLLLLEDFHAPDEARYALRILSSFSVLGSLLHALHLEQATTGQKYSLGTASDPIRAWESARRNIEAFANDPVALLEDLGCIPGSKRRIRTLYRIREFGPELAEEFRGDTQIPKISIFGYPIFIAEDV